MSPGASARAVGTVPATGWYGKVPALGDFVSRRCPASFRDPWDAWLAQGMLVGERAHGDDWATAFLSFPMWRFLWFDGASRTPWAGVLSPGADRVGRLFPLTIVRPLCTDDAPCPSIEALDRWMDGLEASVLALLADDDVDAFDRAVAAADPLAATDAVAAAGPCAAPDALPALALPAAGMRGPFAVAIEGVAPGRLAQAIALHALATAGRPVAWFWRRDAAGAARVRMHGGAPDAATFVALVQADR